MTCPAREAEPQVGCKKETLGTVKRLRLNEKSVSKAAPEPGRDYQIFDSEVRGFVTCIYRSGNRAFTLDYRYAGRRRRMTLGRWPEWSTAAAREPAKELRRDIDAVGDPLGVKEDGRDAPASSRDRNQRRCAPTGSARCSERCSPMRIAGLA